MCFVLVVYVVFMDEFVFLFNCFMFVNMVILVLFYFDLCVVVVWLGVVFGFDECLCVGDYCVQLCFGSVCIVVVQSGLFYLFGVNSMYVMMVCVVNLVLYYCCVVVVGVCIVSVLIDYVFGECQYMVVDFGGYVWIFLQIIVDCELVVWGGELIDVVVGVL